MTDDTLPPMPQPAYTVPMGGYLYTADQMRSYAAQAADAERERCAELANLALDAGRLNWLESLDGEFHNIDRISSVVGVGFNRLPTLRGAIDAAMAADAGATMNQGLSV